MELNKYVWLIVIILTSVAFLGSIASMVVLHTTSQRYVETIDANVQPNTLVELTKVRIVSVYNITNGTPSTLIDAGNYSLDTENSSIRVIDNRTQGSDWVVTYLNNDGVVGGGAGTLFAVTILIIIAGFLVIIYGKTIRGKGR